MTLHSPVTAPAGGLEGGRIAVRRNFRVSDLTCEPDLLPGFNCAPKVLRPVSATATDIAVALPRRADLQVMGLPSTIEHSNSRLSWRAIDQTHIGDC
jgi:hypothetical protein